MPWFDAIGNSSTAPAAGVAAGPAASVPKLHRACAEFESLFLNQLLKQMRATVVRSGFLDGGAAGETYTAMLDSHLARVMAAGGGIGLASMLQRQLDGAGPAAGAGRDGEPDSHPSGAFHPKTAAAVSPPIKVNPSGRR